MCKTPKPRDQKSKPFPGKKALARPNKSSVQPNQKMLSYVYFEAFINDKP